MRLHSMSQPYTQSSQHIRGFSLIEVLVSLALFAIVVTMSVGSMLVMIDANAKAQVTQTIVSNASFALDSMTRDIRTGTNFVCNSIDVHADDTPWDNALSLDDNDASPLDCAGGTFAFAFTETGASLTGGYDTNRIGFRLKEGRIERKISTRRGASPSVWQSITADSVNITGLEFVVTGTDDEDYQSPLVTITIAGEGVGEYQNTEFSLRTTVTQRALDIAL